MQRRTGCVSEEDIRAVEDSSEKFQRRVFDGLVADLRRRDLATAFRTRNREPRPFTGAGLQGVVPVSPSGLEAALQRESTRTRGYVGFSLPAYSDGRHALVYASYTCGGLCGYGWFFLLERQGDSWKVLDAAMMWIS
jgi:hypothetical protein